MAEQKSGKVLVVDGSGHILGRLASIIAKRLLEGERIVVVNTEKIVVSGRPSEVIKQYKKTILPVRSHHSHKWRPKRPRSPVRLFKSTVKGMLPKNNKRGREALSRLKAYVGVPDEFKGAELIRFEDADASRLARGYVELGRIARELGWKGGVDEQ
ncbi:MAG: 50S ribosomal protein L13 [Desulfurococcales archaeon]|nr:50S ribosomal protein L13 [Desulfurococcales archaeon]